MRIMDRRTALIRTGGLVVAALAVATSAAADSGRIRTAGPVLAAPSAGARPTGTLRVGTAVTLGEHRGFWVRVQAGATQGWLKLSQISLSKDSTGQDMAALATGRTGQGNVVSASGGRGLDTGDDIARATPNPAALAQVARSAVSSSAADAYALAGHLKARHLDYLPAPRASDETQP